MMSKAPRQTQANAEPKGSDVSLRRTKESPREIADTEPGPADFMQEHAALASFLENAPDAVLAVTDRGRIIFANSLATDLFGYTRTQLLNQRIDILVSKELRGKHSQHLYEFFRSLDPRPIGIGMDVEGLHKSGNPVSIEIGLSPLEAKGGKLAVCAIRDISRRKRAEQRIALSETRLNEAQRIAKIGNWEWDIVTNHDWWSDELYRMLGIDPKEQEPSFDLFLELVHPEDRQRLRDTTEQTLARGGSHDIDVRVVLRDGTEKYLQSQGQVSLEVNGDPIRMSGTLQDITDRKKAENEIQLNASRFKEAQRIAKIGNWEWDLVHDEEWWSDELYSILEEDPNTYEASFKNFLDKVHPDDREGLIEGTKYRPVNVEACAPFEIRILPSEGRQKIVEMLVAVRPDEAGRPAAVIGTIHDITERKELETKLRDSEDRYASTVELSAIGICHVAADGRFIWANQRLCDMLGYTEQELLGLAVKDISHPEDAAIAEKERARLHAGEIRSLKAEKRYLRRSGAPIWASTTITVKREPDGTPQYDIGMIEDISARKAAEERVQYLATHDEMTDLPNRATFSQLLDHAIESARRNDGRCAVLFIDLDRFKIINDSLGHEAGDLLLQEMASRLQRCVRRSDVVARLGGDEFVVLLEDLTDAAAAAEVAKKVLSTILDSVEIKGLECRVTASIGIATYPGDARDAASLMRHADTAMYLAKEAGKNNFQFYSKDISPISVERLALETRLGHALENKELSIRYQPRVDLRTGMIKGTEALLRWWNHELGTISPAQFIPLAEDTGLIVPIGKWALRTACSQNVAWQLLGLPPIAMAVNLSSRQFNDPDLFSDITDVLEETGMAPEYLELEITESMIMNNVEQAAERIMVLKNLGVKLAIDDFGTGYSSLSQLKSFPIDTLKIDRSFIRDIPASNEDKAITEAVICLGKTLSVTVVAEGVETSAQHAFLRSRGCDEAQGFYFSKACHPDAFAEILGCNGHSARTAAG